MGPSIFQGLLDCLFGPFRRIQRFFRSRRLNGLKAFFHTMSSSLPSKSGKGTIVPSGPGAAYFRGDEVTLKELQSGNFAC
mmetsp:Transcript_14822/g.26925  ORF Transcript_14822/g.26925 Transcript_14822/m.26925 type:complete len:80 (-) Transcript_14822:39-278(-)